MGWSGEEARSSCSQAKSQKSTRKSRIQHLTWNPSLSQHYFLVPYFFFKNPTGQLCSVWAWVIWEGGVGWWRVGTSLTRSNDKVQALLTGLLSPSCRLNTGLLFSLGEGAKGRGPGRAVSCLFRSHIGSEMEIGWKLHPERSPHTRHAGLLTSCTCKDGKDHKQGRHLLPSHTGKWLNMYTIVPSKMKILRHLRDNLVQI